jgi:hypothetical protein
VASPERGVSIIALVARGRQLATGARPAKANLTSRYRFTQGRLKGVYVGGALAFQGAPLMQQSRGRDLCGNSSRRPCAARP